MARIGEHSFCKCKQIQSISLPPAFKETEMEPFANFTSLQTVIIPNGVTKIGPLAFESCSTLQMIALPKHTIIDNVKNPFDCRDILHESNIINCLQNGFVDICLCTNFVTISTIPQQISHH